VKYIRIAVIFLLCAIFFVTPVAANPRGDLGIESYIYNIVGPGRFMATPAPLPYRYSRSLLASDIGVDSFVHINEIVYHDGRFFLTNGPSLVVLDNEFNLIAEITGIYNEGVFENFTTLDGVFVTRESGEIYVAEPGGARIIHFDAELNLIRTLGRPEGIPLSEAFPWQPIKVAVDENGRIYVIANNVFEGIVEKNPDGTFNRYFGVVNIRYSLMDLFWRALRTPAQRARMALWLPVNFTNLTIDPDGFVFAVISEGDQDEPVRKLNARGENILRRPSDDHFFGDSERLISAGFGVATGPSILTHVHVTDFGVFYVLDRNRNRVFAYDEDGHLLFAFGGSGTREGFTQIVMGMAVTDNMLVLTDRGSRSLEVFELTSYGNNVLSAARHQANANWHEAAYYWRQVLDINPHFQYAHLGLGRWYFRMGYYEEAALHFQRAQNVTYYNMAYTRTRGAFFDRHFNTLIIGLAVIAAGIIALNITKKVRVVRRQKRGVTT
jgi:hypothetical protein